MKNVYLVTVVLILCTFSAFSQNRFPLNAGLGPAIETPKNYGELPQTIKSFLESYFPGAAVDNGNFNTIKGIYIVRLNSGTVIDFSGTGEWMQIEAINNTIIPVNVLKALLPLDAYTAIENDKLLYHVVNMQRYPNNGYKVGIRIEQNLYFQPE